MPGRRYYCHYCNVSFPYSREGRRKHNSGSVHARLRQRHYERFQSSQQQYLTELKKEKCRKFLTSQGCNYGHECVYSHLTQEQLNVLKLKAEEEKILEEFGGLPSQSCNELMTATSADDASQLIFKLRRQRLLAKYPALLGISDSLVGDGASNSRPPNPELLHGNGLIVSENLRLYEPLPPSLLPYTIDDVLSQDIPMWGA